MCIRDRGSPETLEHWREAWAEMCNAKFAEKGLAVRIDHRSYERPVSYTHLDVYKRQVTGRAKRRDRATKSQKPNGMGAADERLQGTGRGDCESGIDL